MSTVTVDQLRKHLLSGKKIIDVRASIEFIEGAIPQSVNLPILNDQERELVGTCYKKSGQDAAIQLGHQLVSGENKENKINQWKQFITENPETIVTCFRGGLRSRTAQQFLKEKQIEILRLQGGYKEARNFFINHLKDYSQKKSFRVLSGTTGSGKTHLLNKIKKIYPAIDLENLANHRGSAFGKMDTAQPSQANFENQLSFEILKQEASVDQRPILFEDESRLIGIRNLPEDFFNQLRNSKVILVEQTLDQRIENIFFDYITDTAIANGTAEQAVTLFEKYKQSTFKIEKKLGGLRAKEISQDIEQSKNEYLSTGQTLTNKVWIEKLLVWYYDPLYLSSLERRKPVVEFKGSPEAILNFLSTDKTK